MAAPSGAPASTAATVPVPRGTSTNRLQTPPGRLVSNTAPILAILHTHGKPIAMTAAVVIGLHLLKKLFKARPISEHIVPTIERQAPTVLDKAEPTLEDVPAVVSELRASFLAGLSRPYAHRKQQLKQLLKMVEDNEEALIKALEADLGRPRFEAVVYDLEFTKHEIKTLLRKLKQLMRTKSVPSTLLTFPSRNHIYQEPYGVALVIGTWNYPIMLTLAPLAGAIAAGNCVVLKPSNVSLNTANLICDLVHKYLDHNTVVTVGKGLPGDRGAINALLDQHTDYIFFTGGPTVGRLVMEKAAANLTPVTLELGGKNPVFVAADADLALAAKRTIWGRMMNGGQQCISPDYVMVEASVKDAFIRECVTVIRQFYGADPKVPGKLGRIVNDRHTRRLSEVISKSGGVVHVGGEIDDQSRYVAPTVLELDLYSPVMNEETFGPILMVCSVPNMDAAIRYAASQPKPLSMYIFSSSNATQERILQNTSAGGVTINGTLFHVGHSKLPFGGVGRSGMGAYHGKRTFYTFSHAKPVLRKSWLPDFGLLSDPFFLYPPWNNTSEWIIRKLFALM